MMMIKWMAVLLMLMAGLLLALPARAQEDTYNADEAIAFLETMQNPDGGFTNGFAPESDLATTADVVIAAVAAGHDPNAFFSGDMLNPFAFLGTQVSTGSLTGPGQIAKVLTAVIAAGKDPLAFAGHNLVEDLLAQQGENGLFGAGAFDHCLALIALQNAGVELPAGSVEVLLEGQDEAGGWGFMAGNAPDTNTTGLCLQALALTGETEAVEAGLDYLAAIQNEDGGWPYQNPSDFGTDSDANSTALVLQALIAAGQDLTEWNDPQDGLAALQLESGAFAYQTAQPGDSIPATVAVIPALEGVALNAWATSPAAE
jgi:hypothetical protein